MRIELIHSWAFSLLYVRVMCHRAIDKWEEAKRSERRLESQQYKGTWSLPHHAL